MYFDRRAHVDRRQQQIPVITDRRNGNDRRAHDDRRTGKDRRIELRSDCHDRRAYI